MTTLYHRTSNGNIKVWNIWRDGVRVTRQWGILNGKLQESTETFIGNSRMNALEEAEFDMQRSIRYKTEEGFVDALDKVRDNHELSADDMDAAFSTGILPDAFAPAKPVSEIDRETAFRRATAGDFIIQRKRDGQRHFAMWNDAGVVSLWSRQIENVTDRFPRLVSYLQSFTYVSTILDGEVIVDRDGADDFRAVGSVSRAKGQKAADAEATLPVRFYVFDVLYLFGSPLYRQPYETRYDLIQRIASQYATDPDARRYVLQPDVFPSLVDAETLVHTYGWEGLVLWDKAKPTIVRMDGKETRTNCYKFKPVQTGDFLATGYELGKGKCANVVGKLKLQDRHGRDIGLVGSGFDDATRKDALTWEYPCVVELEFDRQEPDSGKLRFPVFVRKRDDKRLTELD